MFAPVINIIMWTFILTVCTMRPAGDYHKIIAILGAVAIIVTEIGKIMTISK